MRAAADLERQSGGAAEAAYRAAVAQWPDAPLPALGLGNVAAARGDWREAENWFRRAQVLDPASVAALNNRVEALQRLGCPGAASRVLGDGIVHVAADDPLRPALAATARELDGVPSGADPATCGEFASR
jgi:predicted Zn-dependent protease